jgi:hypothetical protein
MSKTSWTLSTLFGVALFVVAAPQAHAQQLQLGTFKLPVEAYFGDTVLQPGEYTISRVQGLSVIQIRGDAGTATILANSVDSEPQFDRGKMTLAAVNGTFALTRFDSGLLGRRYDFRPSKKSFGKNSERASVGHPATLEIDTR